VIAGPDEARAPTAGPQFGRHGRRAGEAGAVGAQHGGRIALQPVGRDVLAAGHAIAVAAVGHALQRILDLAQLDAAAAVGLDGHGFDLQHVERRGGRTGLQELGGLVGAAGGGRGPPALQLIAKGDEPTPIVPQINAEPASRGHSGSPPALPASLRAALDWREPRAETALGWAHNRKIVDNSPSVAQ
jgi:hypothetical protein